LKFSRFVEIRSIYWVIEFVYNAFLLHPNYRLDFSDFP
jgi:hypothetical protein